MKIKVALGTKFHIFEDGVRHETTFGELKELAAKHFDIDPQDYKFLYRGRPRPDSHTLDDAGVLDRTALTLSRSRVRATRLRRGGRFVDAVETPEAKKRKEERLQREEKERELNRILEPHRAKYQELETQVAALQEAHSSGTGYNKQHVIGTADNVERCAAPPLLLQACQRPDGFVLRPGSLSRLTAWRWKAPHGRVGAL
eukprot:scaffold3886_cov399-Prasinococcus_capsulatus_cf.AAC.10